MTLDKNKRYEFLGDVYAWQEHGIWLSTGYSWMPRDFQHFADRGAVKEVREPIVGSARVSFGKNALCVVKSVDEILGLTADQARNRTFDIVATEVM